MYIIMSYRIKNKINYFKDILCVYAWWIHMLYIFQTWNPCLYSFYSFYFVSLLILYIMSFDHFCPLRYTFQVYHASLATKFVSFFYLSLFLCINLSFLTLIHSLSLFLQWSLSTYMKECERDFAFEAKYSTVLSLRFA